MALTLEKKLTLVREHRGFSQAELAKLCGFARSTIARYESGKVVPSVDHARALGRALDVTPGYFITDDDDRDLRPLRNVLAKESLRQFAQCRSVDSVERADLWTIATHDSAPTTIVGWQDLLSMIRAGVISIPAASSVPSEPKASVLLRSPSLPSVRMVRSELQRVRPRTGRSRI